MWKLDNSYTKKEKTDKAKAFGNELMKLVGIIPEIKDFRVNYNSVEAPDSNHDLVLDSTFNSWEELKSYQNHPDHVGVVEFGKSIKKQKACVDFEQ